MIIKKDTPLKKVLELGKDCKRCSHCCSHGSGALFGDDLKNIAIFLGVSEEELKAKYLEEIEKFHTKLLRPKILRENKPYGRCIFLEGKNCKIQYVKPLECRTGNCSQYGEELSLWFMLNHFINANDPQSIREFAVYLKAGGKTLPKGKLEDFVADKERLNKILSYNILA